jgi:type I restriction-modification system DNA methylase subunit
VPNSSRQLLDAAYTRLGFADGDLLSAADEPNDSTSPVWVDKGDWLALAKKVGAEKVFFVDTYPVIVFAEQKTADPAEWFQWFNSVWCMARPQLLFLAREGELSVFNLTKQPARPGEEPARNDRLLDVVRATADVQDRLHRYRRDQVESGRLFEDDRFGFDDRADRALVRDLGKVRKALIDAGLPAGYAHALIGRSIFIRYLEDRRVLTDQFFRRIAQGDRENWGAILDEAREGKLDFGGGQPIFYPYVLTNKAFTYALFAQLAKRFNGDMFPVDPEEQKAVTEKHLKLLHRFLLGGKDEKLFFFAYRFDIIPIELISSIYEKFYSLEKKKKRDEGSFYTPSALVDFVLSHTLTDELLAKSPRVMDPACGSGIFLVEAFRRIVRYRVGKIRRPLTAEELREILRQQIAGIDINPEAIRVAAFSLYLAMLHYLDPPDILQHKLPGLTYAARPKADSQRYYDILVAEDAFRVEETVSDEAVRKRFLSDCADVVVGNPPWGAPQSNEPEEIRSDGGIAWCAKRKLEVGDKERSQTFLHRTVDLLRDGGSSGLLVSTGVFFKRHQKTKLFREQWLEEITLKKVVNFAAVRDAFFRGTGDEEGSQSEGSIAPFAAVVFEKRPAPEASHFTYWSAKETAFVRRVQAVVLNRADLRAASQDDYKRDDTLWKIYWWGGHRDEALICRLRLEPSFKQVVDPDGERMRVGFQEASRKDPAGWLRKFLEFPTDAFERYGPLPKDKFIKPPTRVHRRRERNIYEGPRLLIKRGIDQRPEAGGQIAARFETEPFCFRDSIHCAPLADFGEEKAKVLLAILWSSLTRYYLFLTSGTWGLWHDEVKKDVLYSIPVKFPKKASLKKKLVTAVDALRDLPEEAEAGSLFGFVGIPKEERDSKIRELEGQLDEAVYELFELSDEERERIDEVCGLGLDLFYRGMGSAAASPLDWPDTLAPLGRRADLRNGMAIQNEICAYLSTFINLWEPQLEDQAGQFRWRVIRPLGASTMLAAVFQTETAAAPLPPPDQTDDQVWGAILGRLSDSSRQPTKARRVYIDGLIRIVTDEDVVIIKRNERRLWTKSSARDDAEATMVMAMELGQQGGRREGAHG